MLFATTSNGVYRCDIASRRVRRVLGNKHTPGLFRARALGYFGITRHDPTGHILVASRERDKLFNKLVTGVKLHLIDPSSLRAKQLAVIDDVYDVHQIACHDDRVFLTDTGGNRIVIYNTLNGARTAANLGSVRRDINHINAVVIRDGYLHIGLNNRGTAPAEMLRLPLSLLDATKGEKEVDITTAGEYTLFHATLHTHDLEPDSTGRLFACKSHDGIVFEVETRTPLLEIGGWVRGLAFGPDCLCVGTSEFADRKRRHSEKLDGAISVYSLPDLKRLDRLVLPGAGQVNDLLYLERT